MGAKTAMAVSFRRPDLTSAMIAVDNAPVNARLSAQFPNYIKGMKEIEAAHVKTSRAAYKIMSKYEPSLTVQHFLLSNFKRKHRHEYRFRVPVNTLGDSLDNLADFPFSPAESKFEGPALFIRGTLSN